MFDSSLVSVAVELVWFGVEAASFRLRGFEVDVPGVAVPLPDVDAVADVVSDVDADGIVVAKVFALVEGSLSSSFDGVEARESLSLPLELAPSDFLAFGVAPNGMRLAKIDKNQLNNSIVFKINF